MQPNFVTLQSGVKAFWVGDPKTAKYICVYYHGACTRGVGTCTHRYTGGGFSLDGDDTHLKFWHGVQKDAQSSDITIAFLFLEYTLVPHATYPKPVYEAVEAVKYVMEDLKRPASQIILAGDSAGGNMCLAVLSQIMHPSADFPELKLGEGEKLKAIVAVAPWVSFRLEWPSEEKNRYKDLVSHYAGNKWATDYLAGKPTTPYAEPLTAPADWWKDAKVEQILAVSGANEVILDSIDEWVEKYKVSWLYPLLLLPRHCWMRF
jgi:acetyl esterase/lipase